MQGCKEFSLVEYRMAITNVADYGWPADWQWLMSDRVACIRKGGLRFYFQGNGYWLLVYVMNVGGGGDISGMWVKGSGTGWILMSHNWGASYQAFATLGGQALSFRITSYTTRQTITAWNVAPSNWNVGWTYGTNVNFRWCPSCSPMALLPFLFNQLQSFCLSRCVWIIFLAFYASDTSYSPCCLPWEQMLMPRV